MKRIALLAILAPVMMIGCKADNPGLTGRVRPPAPVQPPKLEPRDFDKTYPYETAESKATQDKYDKNTVKVMFQISKDKQSVQNLTEKDFRVQENGVQVTKFQIDADKKVTKQLVDIVFAVDVTGSMGPFITEAKQVLKDFVKSTAADYHIRICLTTFGDKILKKCDKFFDATSKKQQGEFLAALAGLSIKKGQGEEAGFLDWEENSMRALLEATKVTWEQDSKRFVVLVSDADFYSPEKPSKHFEHHQANPDFWAPSIKDVNAAILSSKVTVFSITPPATGYNSPLNGEPDITATSNGQWFQFDSVIDNNQPKRGALRSIMNGILDLVDVTYTLTYIVDENPGLSVSLTEDKRNVDITHNNGGTVTKLSTRSSMPDGRPQYKTKFKVSDSALKRDSVKVWVDGKPLTPGTDFSVQKGEVDLKTAPGPNAKLRFEYFYEEIEKNFRFEPLTFAGALNATNTKVWLNGQEARPEHLTFSPDGEGNTIVGLSDEVLSAADPYKIGANAGLKVRILAN